MLETSPYTSLKHRKDALLNQGFDYNGQIFRRTMSSQMFASNATFVAFLGKVEVIVYELIQQVKHIKTHFNPAMDKDQRTLN